MQKILQLSCALAVLLATTLAPNATAQTVIFSESEFEPASWSLVEPFWSTPPVVGETFSMSTNRFQAGNPVNNFMLQQFTLNIPQGEFNSVWAPVMMTQFNYDPSTEGPITEISGSLKTLPVVQELPFHNTGVRAYLLQDGHIFSTGAYGPGEWTGFGMDEPEFTRTFAGFVAEDFFELVPNIGFELDSHPNFAGGPIQFGFGLQLTSAFLEGMGEVILSGGFDNVSLRIETIPEPASLSLLALGAVTLMRRRRRG